MVCYILGAKNKFGGHCTPGPTVATWLVSAPHWDDPDAIFVYYILNDSVDQALAISLLISFYYKFYLFY